MESKIIIVLVAVVCFFTITLTADSFDNSEMLRQILLCRLYPSQWRTMCFLEAFGYDISSSVQDMLPEF